MTTDTALHSKQRMRALFHSIGASIAGRALAIGLSLVSVPIALRYLGTEQYGLWATVTSLVGMLVFADLGVGNGMLNAVAAANGRDSKAGVRSAIASGASAVALVAVVFLALFLMSWPFVNWASVFALKGAMVERQVSLAVLVLIVIFSINMPVSIIQKVQYGLQQGRWVSLSQATAAVLSLGMTLAVVHFDLGLVGLVGCFVLASLVADAGFGWIFLRRHTDIIPTRHDWNKSEFKQLFQLGLSFLLLQVGVSLCYASDNFILSQLVGHESVAVYSVHQKLFSPITFIASLALTPLWPAFSDAISRNDIRWVKRTLTITCVLMFFWALVSGIGLLFCSDWLMRHWLKGQIQPNMAISIAMVAWACVDLVGRTIAMFANGAGLLRQQLAIVAVFVPLCIGLKVLLVHQMGVQGVVVGTAAAWLMVHIPAYTHLLRKWARSVAEK